jgi:hypothetical protein
MPLLTNRVLRINVPLVRSFRRIAAIVCVCHQPSLIRDHVLSRSSGVMLSFGFLPPIKTKKSLPSLYKRTESPRCHLKLVCPAANSLLRYGATSPCRAEKGVHANALSIPCPWISGRFPAGAYTLRAAQAAAIGTVSVRMLGSPFGMPSAPVRTRHRLSDAFAHAYFSSSSHIGYETIGNIIPYACRIRQAPIGILDRESCRTSTRTFRDALLFCQITP